MRWIVLALGLVVGMVLVGYDRSTDDTGVEATIILVISLLLTLLAPRVPLAIALAVALPMTVFNGSAPGLLFAGVGAAVGYAMRRGTQLSRAG
jgi:hypothetical protein